MNTNIIVSAATAVAMFVSPHLVDKFCPKDAAKNIVIAAANAKHEADSLMKTIDPARIHETAVSGHAAITPEEADKAEPFVKGFEQLKQDKEIQLPE